MKAFRVAIFSSCVVFAGCVLTATGGPPVSDLGSPLQEVRDSAAATIRSNYVAPDRSIWDSLNKKLQADMSRQEVLAILGSVTNNPEGGGGSGGSEVLQFRLDDYWQIQCFFSKRGTNEFFKRCSFVEHLKIYFVSPPPQFTGVWRVYYVNGQKSGEGNFKNGRPDGESVGYYSDGKRMLVNHSVNGLLEGEEIAFHPNGKVMYRGQYKRGNPVGIWKWLKEDGSVQSELDYSKLPTPK